MIINKSHILSKQQITYQLSTGQNVNALFIMTCEKQYGLILRGSRYSFPYVKTIAVLCTAFVIMKKSHKNRVVFDAFK